MCSACRLDRAAVLRCGSSSVVYGRQLGRARRPAAGDGVYGSGCASSSTSASMRSPARGVRGVEIVVAHASVDEDVLDEEQPLAEVVERGDVTR